MGINKGVQHAVLPSSSTSSTLIKNSYNSFQFSLHFEFILKASNRVFHSLYKVGRNRNFVFKGFNNSRKKLPPVGLDLVQEIITDLGVQCLTI